MRVLGIDAGATKTECLLADENGATLGQSKGPGANFQLFAEDELSSVLETLAQEALSGEPVPVDVLCLGMAGAGRERDFDVMRRVLRRLGLARENLVTHDALVALVAGAEEPYGVALIVGTGAAAFGVNRAGREARAGGWGPLLGDEGSGYWMGLRALRAVMRSHDGRAQPTLLTDAILSRLGAADPEALVHRVYRELAREEVAALAPLVQDVADLGDLEAQSIIDEALREFLRAAESVIGKLDLAGERFPLVLSGGLWKAVPVLVQDTAPLVRKIAPWAEVRELRVPPARGAVTLALTRAAGAPAADPPAPPRGGSGPPPPRR